MPGYRSGSQSLGFSEGVMYDTIPNHMNITQDIISGILSQQDNLFICSQILSERLA
jgi:hypothetical protein